MTDPIQKLIDEAETHARDRADCPMCEGLPPAVVGGVVQHCEGCAPPTPMAGGTPDTFDAGEPAREPLPEMLAAEACIRHLSREPGFASWWSTLGGMGQAFYHDAMGDLIRARMVDSDGEIEAEIELLTSDRKIIAQARDDATRLAPGRGPSRSHKGWDGPHDDPGNLVLQLLGFAGDSPGGLWAHVKHCATHGNTMAAELLRQDEAAKLAKIGERP